MKRLHLSYFLDLIRTWTLHLKKIFGMWLDLDRVLKDQDWIRIAKCDSPLISGVKRHF